MKQKLYHRERYLERLRPFYHDDDIIKVITGVRRCGKSCLMATVAEELLASGVESPQWWWGASSVKRTCPLARS
jgi:predicted AAA+ superfamily ATPase